MSKIGQAKVLVLGGTGLIGSEIVKRLAKEGNQVTIVSLGSLADRNAFKQLKEEFPSLKHVSGNVFLPTKYKDRTFNELVESDHFLEEFLRLLYVKPDHREFFLNKIVRQLKPDLIVDSINSATVLSYTKSGTIIRDYLEGKEIKLETLLATLSIPRLINFFDCLYKTFQETPSVKTYLKIGTTGTGGMGFNIPYTHGESKPSFQLLEKAAISGAYTSLLYTLSQTFGMPEIKEVKPAALVGYKKVDSDRVLLSRNSSQSLKVYEFRHTRKIDLRQLTNLDFEKFKTGGIKEDFKAVFVDTGENGQFSEEEFRAISNPRQMGFITKEEIADVVLDQLGGKSSDKDMVREFSKAVLGPTAKAQKVREDVLKKMDELAEKSDEPSLAFEVLGPPRLAKLIFEAYLIENRTGFKTKFEPIKEKDLSNEEVSLIVRKQKIPAYYSRISEENINNWASDGWVDLRRENIDLWNKRISDYKKTNKSIEIGDIVAWIFEHEDHGFRK